MSRGDANDLIAFRAVAREPSFKHQRRGEVAHHVAGVPTDFDHIAKCQRLFLLLASQAPDARRDLRNLPDDRMR